MKTPLRIIQCENGFIILEDNLGMYPNSYEMKKWIALTPQSLGELIEKLAEEGDPPRTRKDKNE